MITKWPVCLEWYTQHKNEQKRVLSQSLELDENEIIRFVQVGIAKQMETFNTLCQHKIIDTHQPCLFIRFIYRGDDYEVDVTSYSCNAYLLVVTDKINKILNRNLKPKSHCISANVTHQRMNIASPMPECAQINLAHCKLLRDKIRLIEDGNVHLAPQLEAGKLLVMLRLELASMYK